jgi:hypothetical protein
MRKISVLMLISSIYFVLLIMGCTEQKRSIAISSLPIEIRTPVSLYLELIKNHLVDEEWRKENIENIFHPNIDFLSGPRTYSTITEKLAEPIQGDRLFTKVEITNVIRGQERVDHSTPNNEKQDSFFVKLSYSVIGIIMNHYLKILDRPTLISEYIILGLDNSTKQYKIIDYFPYVDKYNFISAQYAKQNMNLFFSNNGVSEELGRLTKRYEE